MSHADKGDGAVDTEGRVVHGSNVNPHDGVDLSTGILTALDSVPGYDVENSDAVVFDHVDLDALDELFTDESAEGTDSYVTFPIDGYQVTVTAGGEITIAAR